MYIATASTFLEGAPRFTKYHSSNKRPQVQQIIVICQHRLMSTTATKRVVLAQGMPRKPGQRKFKTELSSRLMKIGASKARITRCLEPKDDAQVGFTGPHVMKNFPRLRNNKHSYYCRHTVTHSQPSKGTKSHGFVESVGLHTLCTLQRPEELVLRCTRCMEFLKRDISVPCLN